MKKRYYLIRLGKREQVIKKIQWELDFLKQVQYRDEVSESQFVALLRQSVLYYKYISRATYGLSTSGYGMQIKSKSAQKHSRCGDYYNELPDCAKSPEAVFVKVLRYEPKCSDSRNLLIYITRIGKG